MNTVTMTNDPPGPPPSDFSFCVDFRRGEGPASRVFLATYDFISACESLDRALVEIIDSSIEPVMVLEDIEAASLKTYFRNKLESVDDQALKSVLDWRTLIGHYLVKCKYIILELMNGEPDGTSIISIRTEIQKAASETDVRHLPAYAEPRPSDILKGIKDFQSVKDRLLDGDRAYIEAPNMARLNFNLTARWDIDTIQELSTTQRQVSTSDNMTLIVKKPDYLGDSKWDLRHGDRSISVKIEDMAWLRSFQDREVNILPGDALRCKVRTETAYGLDNEVLSENFYIEEVREVVRSHYQTPMF